MKFVAPKREPSEGETTSSGLGEPPKIILPLLETVVVEERQSFNLKCTYTGYPIPEAKWFRDQEELTEENR